MPVVLRLLQVSELAAVGASIGSGQHPTNANPVRAASRQSAQQCIFAVVAGIPDVLMLHPYPTKRRHHARQNVHSSVGYVMNNSFLWNCSQRISESAQRNSGSQMPKWLGGLA